MMSGGGWIDPNSYGIHSRQYLGHTFRYYLAKGFLCPDDSVLDVSCGCGYGSVILAADCRQVLGLDVDAGALAKAHSTYHIAGKTRFAKCDLATTDELPKCDVVVSFETIEHIDRDPAEFIRLIKGAANRLIILSCPVIPTVGINPHHVHDFTEEEVIGLLLDEEWNLWEKIKQGPYLLVVAYRAATGGT